MSSQINALSQLPVLQRFIAETQEREAKSKYSKNYDYARLRFMWIMRSCLVDAGLFLVKMLKAGQQEAVGESSCIKVWKFADPRCHPAPVLNTATATAMPSRDHCFSSSRADSVKCCKSRPEFASMLASANMGFLLLNKSEELV